MKLTEDAGRVYIRLSTQYTVCVRLSDSLATNKARWCRSEMMAMMTNNNKNDTHEKKIVFSLVGKCHEMYTYVYEKRKYQQFKIKCCFLWCVPETRRLKSMNFKIWNRAKRNSESREKSEWKKINERTNGRTNEHTHTSLYLILYTITFSVLLKSWFMDRHDRSRW